MKSQVRSLCLSSQGKKVNTKTSQTLNNNKLNTITNKEQKTIKQNKNSTLKLKNFTCHETQESTKTPQTIKTSHATKHNTKVDKNKQNQQIHNHLKQEFSWVLFPFYDKYFFFLIY
ncbi:hypothetical protein ISN44_As13g009070 [Arabidopsis suecica]|uniref:Uncharacterized protein n=1 Tax=Arabidopsis suecica TaxID=45249 RepID=A0A8T1XQI0_ARASU|nr:hypothetical protein ISN44_As13g009070 [Arabidopsis suecica]